jgi:hypothetical protein
MVPSAKQQTTKQLPLTYINRPKTKSQKLITTNQKPTTTNQTHLSNNIVNYFVWGAFSILKLNVILAFPQRTRQQIYD